VRVVGLSSKVDRNSVRVSGGKGEAVILEVSYNTKWEPKTKDDGSERSTLQRELDQLAEQIARQEEGLARIAVQLTTHDTHDTHRTRRTTRHSRL
jgi:uncharacterized protein (DUF1501 family)